MHILKKSFMSALLVAGLSFAPPAKAQQTQAPSQQQLDGAISTFNSMSPEERQQMLNTAVDAFRNMPEDQKQALINQAKTRVENLSDAQKSAYENEFKNVLTPEQKQKIIDQLKQEGITKDSFHKNDKLAPAPAAADNLTQSLKSLTPEQRQKMIDALKSLNGSSGQQ